MAAGIISVIAAADWYVGSRASLGPLYVLPMMLAATVLSPFQTAALAILCSLLRSWFDLPSPLLESLLRFGFAVVAYTGCGLIVTSLIRNRELAELRRRAEEQLDLLVDSSPAGVLTTDADGWVMACNNAAQVLLAMPEGSSLQGQSIGD